MNEIQFEGGNFEYIMYKQFKQRKPIQVPYLAKVWDCQNVGLLNRQIIGAHPIFQCYTNNHFRVFYFTIGLCSLKY